MVDMGELHSEDIPDPLVLTEEGKASRKAIDAGETVVEQVVLAMKDIRRVDVADTAVEVACMEEAGVD